MPLALILSIFLLGTACFGQGGPYVPLDPDDPVDFRRDRFIYGGDTVVLGPRAFFIDGQLSEAETADLPFVFSSVNAAVAELEHGTEQDPMVLYLAPYVYWIDDPDDPAIRIPSSGSTPYALEISCAWLRFQGLNRHPENVVLAVNRGQTMGATGNFTMFRFDGEGTAAENVTFGNYCSVDLEYPLAPALGRPKRGEAIVQAQLIHCNGDKIVARNTRFISRLNLCPFVGGKRTLFDHCHFESTDDALAGSAVYLNSTFDFYSSKPWYHTTGTGAVLLNCAVRSFTGGTQYFTKAGGQLAVIDTRFTSTTMTDAAWQDHTPPTTRNYQYAVQLNGTPLLVGAARPETTVRMGRAPILQAYRFTHAGRTIYNTYNLLAGDDDWDPQGIRPLVRAAEAASGARLTGLPVQLTITPAEIDLETGRDSALLTVSAFRFGNYPAAGTQVQWSVAEEDRDVLQVTPRADGMGCRLTPINRADTVRTVTVTATTADGLAAAASVTVRPTMLPPPGFRREPVLRWSAPGKVRVDYALETTPYPDRSAITWYRCATAACADPIPVEVSRDGEPRREYTLSAGDLGWHLRAEVAPRHLRSTAGPFRSAVLDLPVSSVQLPTSSRRVATDFRHLAVGDQPRVLPGFWTFAPLAVDDPRHPSVPGDAWTYGPGSDGSAGMTGLLQRGRTASLSYTPVGDDFGDMRAEVIFSPFKTAGQGFSVAPLYMDVLIDYDAKRKRGHGLRITRGTRYGNAVECYFVRYADGEASPLSEPTVISAFRSPFRLELSLSGNHLRVRGSTEADYARNEYPPEVLDHLDIETLITPYGAGGFGIEYNGGSSTMINEVRLSWE